MGNIIRDIWYKWKIQRLKKGNNLNFDSMRQAKIPHEIIQSVLLTQVKSEYNPPKTKPKFPNIENN
jgi:hypothetical protein